MQTALKILSLIGKVLGMVGFISAYAGALPEKWMPIAGIVFGVASILKDTVNRIGDKLDDGQENNSFR